MYIFKFIFKGIVILVVLVNNNNNHQKTKNNNNNKVEINNKKVEMVIKINKIDILCYYIVHSLKMYL
jgi:signal recognition particle receptor subunit beta